MHADPRDPDDRDPILDAPHEPLLEALLDEELGGVTPPDLHDAILARAGDPARLESPPLHEGTDTMTDRTTSPRIPQNEFAMAGQTRDRGLIGEFLGFCAENSKWWLVPFLVVFGLMSALLLLGSTGAAPFIYTLF